MSKMKLKHYSDPTGRRIPNMLKIMPVEDVKQFTTGDKLLISFQTKRPESLYWCTLIKTTEHQLLYLDGIVQDLSFSLTRLTKGGGGLLFWNEYGDTLWSWNVQLRAR